MPHLTSLTGESWPRNQTVVGHTTKKKYDNLQDRSPKLHSQVQSSKTEPFDKTGGRSRNRKHLVLFMERQTFHVRPVLLRAGEANPVTLARRKNNRGLLGATRSAHAYRSCTARSSRVPRSELLSEMIFRESRSRLCESRTNWARTTQNNPTKYSLSTLASLLLMFRGRTLREARK
jgi:hypothetical protein